MVLDFKELKNVKVENSETLGNAKQEIKEEKIDEVCNDFELCAQNQPGDFEVFLTNRSLNPFVDFPKSLHFKYGPEELRKLHFFVDLWHVQKCVQPLGLPNIILLLECLKKKKAFPTDVVTTHIKVVI